MNFQKKSALDYKKTGMEASFYILSIMPFLFFFSIHGNTKILISEIILPCISSILFIISSELLSKGIKIFKLSSIIAAKTALLSAFTLFKENPFFALFGITGLILFSFYIYDLKPLKIKKKKHLSKKDIIFLNYSLLLLSIIPIASNSENMLIQNIFISAAGVGVQLFFVQWSLSRKKKSKYFYPFLGIFMISAIFFSIIFKFSCFFCLISSISAIFIFKLSEKKKTGKEQWTILLTSQPSRILISSFLLLIMAGSVLLGLRFSAKTGKLPFIDAAFTAVSAVCVTGLATVDISKAFSLTGQVIILLLIQLGGIGIMSITAIGMKFMGKRLSMKDERLLSSTINNHKKDIIDSFKLILKYTIILELIGAIILTLIFASNGDSFIKAVWRGFFTSISAFCNAGFSLQTQSLVSFNNNPLILHSIAILIIAGGTAPAAAILLPKWIKKEKIPVSVFTAFVTTIILLFAGTFFMLAFEWNHSLSPLGTADKFHNAWFQSATFRTAGFNSIDIAKTTPPFFIIMIILMFIGGNPGGTAGGIKTTTISVIAVTFWTNILNKNHIIIKKRRISSQIINRAITIAVSGGLIWTIIVIMLEITQQIPVSDIIFEASSAIGTVGLTTGATARLDEIGKIIIMFAMFAGRVGPMTLFMFLSRENSFDLKKYPDTDINLT